ncbi:hypothetical protein [Paraburkholderia gardini]|uniref:Four helix bundle protein n=1 Tax=Paraburkholderia gardini TaxID=2823469 RepID=A0ABM8U9R8_9BURK|nr:hypothetical protein [Paraburkholderia gardini]CAG4920274.1 hypothetical protein R54767_04696 [Paraburkholderia gardini]
MIETALREYDDFLNFRNESIGWVVENMEVSPARFELLNAFNVAFTGCWESLQRIANAISKAGASTKIEHALIASRLKISYEQLRAEAGYFADAWRDEFARLKAGLPS